MKSVRWNEFRKTFRFRLTMMHILMISAALAVTFVVVLLFIRVRITAEARRQLTNSLLQGQKAYLGEPGLETDQLPEDLLRRIEKQFPKLQIGIVEREEQPGGELYEIIGSDGVEQIEILADPDGEIWVATRRTLAEIYAFVEEAMDKKYSENTDYLIYSAAGKQLAGPLPSIDAALMADLQTEADPTVLRDGPMLLGGIRLYDGNTLYAVHTMKDLQQITVGSLEFFALLMLVFIPLSAWIGMHISQKAMAGVQRVSAAADRVRAGNFSERVNSVSKGTEIDALIHAFNDMIARIEILMQELREVTANIAHDLKTPVMRIRGLLESMEWEEISPDEQQKMLGSALEECDRIVPLIDSILELSRADSGMLVLQQETFDLAEEIQNAHEMFSTLAEDRGIQFECTRPTGPVPMQGDRRRMQRVIANLVDNALKYAPENGQVELALSIENQQAVLTIRDNGPGIPEEELENVFKRFYRLDPSRSTPGHGMGLSLVRAFVHAFGGSVSIESGKGQGCCATVTLAIYERPFAGIEMKKSAP
ncbi:MAG: HAMP domain-containing histidine kinase [Pontiellaceae bacterium]|nr:HAMP domain-containing histidine kinase [Pontiellaceae bacterium]